MRKIITEDFTVSLLVPYRRWILLFLALGIILEVSNIVLPFYEERGTRLIIVSKMIGTCQAYKMSSHCSELCLKNNKKSELMHQCSHDLRQDPEFKVSPENTATIDRYRHNQVDLR
jgi:hypothetical protein